MLDLIANLAIPLIMLFIIVYGKYKKIDVFESFITGAIDGLKTALNILPYIIGIFIAIGIFKSGKGIEMLEFIFAPIANFFKIPKELIGLIIMKPVSGSGALGMYSELAARVSVDSLVEKMGATIVGASETVFYTVSYTHLDVYKRQQIYNFKHGSPSI